MKNLLPVFLAALWTLTLCAFQQRALADDPPKPADGPQAVVRAFMDCFTEPKVDALREMLADTKTCHIVQDTGPDRPGIYVQTWDEWLTWLTGKPQSAHIVDKMASAHVSDDLAIVTFAAHTADRQVDLRAVVVLTRKMGDGWRIVSWTQENSAAGANGQ